MGSGGTGTMRKRFRFLAMVCALGVLPIGLSALELGQGKSGKAKPKNEKKENRREVEFALDFLIDFTSNDARRYATESKLVGQKPLPPGIRKNLARGKRLPPGIAKRNMPETFLKKLPVHDDYEWHMAGTDLVLLSKNDKVVKEIAKDVFK